MWRSYKGGKRLDEFCGISQGQDSQFPEDWIASTVKAVNPGRDNTTEGLAITTDNEYLIDIINRYPEKMLGKKQIEKYGNCMSILVKLLDSSERLVIQVHPTVEFAKKYLNTNFGKTECWYILEAEDDAHVFLGFKEGITREKWIEYFQKQNINAMLNALHKIYVKKGDCILVEGGVPHAIGSGCMMVELQEPTDLMVITERVTPSGIKLSDIKLHNGLGFEKMFDCFDYSGCASEELIDKYLVKPIHLNEKHSIILRADITDKFAMEEVVVNGEYEFPLHGKYCVAIVLDGEGIIAGANQQVDVARSDRMFITAEEPAIRIQSKKSMLDVLICLP